MTALRYSLSALAGTTMAITLLWLMQWLVTSPSQDLPGVEPSRLVEFVRLKREEHVKLKQRTPTPPPEKSSAATEAATRRAHRITAACTATGYGHEP